MPLISTPAIVLSALRYGETSKIVRLATRDHGVQSAIAKGAYRPKSRFGAALQVLSGGQAHLLLSERRDLHTLTGFDVATLPLSLTSEVPRYATATALAEVMLRVAPAEPHPDAYDVLEEALAVLTDAPTEVLPSLSLKLLWRMVGALGFAPALDRCARDGRPIEPGDIAFSAPEGGALCRQCARSMETTTLPADALEALSQLTSREGTLPPLDSRHAAAHRRLLARYIRYHLAEGATLPALEFWQLRAWDPA
ncbi:MAG TPA: DNA repair protein RecO [Gemmatimonadales bacterium]|nr:DNA repair protein RecO [Gemmatimonadales bacterium]